MEPMFVQMKSHCGLSDSFCAIHIVCLPSELLFNFLKDKDPQLTELRNILLENGVLYFHVIWKLCEKGDKQLLAKILGFPFRRHLGKPKVRDYFILFLLGHI